jgi:hypothetical protein
MEEFQRRSGVERAREATGEFYFLFYIYFPLWAGCGLCTLYARGWLFCKKALAFSFMWLDRPRSDQDDLLSRGGKEDASLVII